MVKFQIMIILYVMEVFFFFLEWAMEELEGN